jgi:uncharacterized protein
MTFPIKHSTFRSAWFIPLLLLVFSVLSFHVEAQIPTLPAQPRLVNDFANMLAPQEVELLERKLRTYEDTTSNQIAIVTVTTLDGWAIQEFATRLFEQWKIGKKGKDNGLLLLISKQDRKARIEVGYGLEGRVPDLIASRIISSVVTPNFKNGQYYQGLDQATSALIKACSGEYVADAKQPKSGKYSALLIVFLIVLILFFNVFVRYRKLKNNQVDSRGTDFLTMWSLFNVLGGSGRGRGYDDFRGGGGDFGDFGGFGGGMSGGGGADGSW